MLAMTPTRWWLDGCPGIHLHRASLQGEPGDLYVGVGAVPAGDSAPAQVLNHKLYSPRAPSLSRHVAQADAATVSAWRAQWPHGMASVRRIVVEDASPDTCLSLLLFAQRISRQPHDQAAALGAVQEAPQDGRLARWLDYVDAWEQGHWPDAPAHPGAEPDRDVLRRSPACLLSALAHSLLTQPDAGVRVPTDAGASAALPACLSLLDACIAASATPGEGRLPVGLPEHALADALVEFELQNYLVALKHGIRTQLAVPLAGTDRRLLVDALLLTDLELGGITKLLARHDGRRSWTGRGFALLGLHRPSVADSKFEMTISVDPGTGLGLRDLWYRLESLEDERWQGLRPRGQPRRGIVAYTDPATGQPRPLAPDEPWYDGGPGYTLLGGPRPLLDGSRGSRLHWSHDVLPALWQLYRPFPRALAAGPPEMVAGRRIAEVHWPPGDAMAAGRTPALHGWLAACSSATPALHPGEFLPETQFEVVSLPGGDAVVHAEGITLFNDWTPTPLDVTALKAQAVRLAELSQRYRQLLHGGALAELLREEHAALAAPRQLGFRRLAALRDRALALKAEMTLLGAAELAVPDARGADALRSAIERAWGLPEARHRLAETVSQLDALVAQAWTLLQERRQFLATAVVSMAAVFYVLRDGLAALASYGTANLYETLLPIADALGVDPNSLAALKADARLVDQFDLATVVALALVFGIGLAQLLWRYLGSAAQRRPDQPHGD